MTVVPTGSEHDHSSKQELSYQPKLHQLICYRVKRPSKTLICIHPMNAVAAVIELVVLLLVQKENVTYIP